MTKERMTQFLIKFAYAAVILGLIFAGFKYVLPLLMPFLLALVFAAGAALCLVRAKKAGR